MQYKYIFFDLDGTITESGPGIMNSVAHALDCFQITDQNPAILEKFIGPPLVESFMKYYGLSREQALDGVTYYREYYSVKGIYENNIYDGVRELLHKLNQKGYQLVIATSKPEGYTRQILDYFDLAKEFVLIAGATMDTTRVTKEAVIRYALEQLSDADPAKILMVGDRENDINGAHSNKIKAVGVLYGYGSREELEEAGADYIVGNPIDILNILAKYE